MRVIKHGKFFRGNERYEDKMLCSCGCLFYYDYSEMDIVNNGITEKRYVECPECKLTHLVKEI